MSSSASSSSSSSASASLEHSSASVAQSDAPTPPRSASSSVVVVPSLPSSSLPLAALSGSQLRPGSNSSSTVMSELADEAAERAKATLLSPAQVEGVDSLTLLPHAAPGGGDDEREHQALASSDGPVPDSPRISLDGESKARTAPTTTTVQTPAQPHSPLLSACAPPLYPSTSASTAAPAFGPSAQESSTTATATTLTSTPTAGGPAASVSASRMPPLARPNVKRTLNVMVVGESGLGKTSFIETFFQQPGMFVRQSPPAAAAAAAAAAAGGEEAPQSEQAPIHPRTERIQETSFKLGEPGNILKVNVIDTPGYGDELHVEESWVSLIEELKRRMRIQNSLERVTHGGRMTKTSAVHLCFYFLAPHRIKHCDVAFMRALAPYVNVVPVMAKVDAMTSTEREYYRQLIIDTLSKEGVEVFRFDDEVFAPPFAALGGTSQNPSERAYPWGTAEVENAAHCDVSTLRHRLLAVNLDDVYAQTSRKVTRFLQREDALVGRFAACVWSWWRRNYVFVLFIILLAVGLSRVYVARLSSIEREQQYDEIDSLRAELAQAQQLLRSYTETAAHPIRALADCSTGLDFCRRSVDSISRQLSACQAHQASEQPACENRAASDDPFSLFWDWIAQFHSAGREL